MDQHQDQHVIFQELLTSSLDKIKTLLPKKYLEFRRLIEKSLGSGFVCFMKIKLMK